VRESDWVKMMMQPGILRLLKAFNKIADRDTRHQIVKLVEKLGGVKPIPRKKRSK
jgi:hypothetical protein